MEKMELSRIAASLSQGFLITGRKRILLRICLITLCICTCISVLLTLTVIILEVIENGSFTAGEIGVTFGLILFASLGLGVTLFFWKRNKKIENKLQIWLKDCVVLNALVTRYRDTNKLAPYQQIQVEFSYNGKVHKKLGATGNWWIGYNKVFGKYMGKNVDILYSPKNDEVIFTISQLNGVEN